MTALKTILVVEDEPVVARRIVRLTEAIFARKKPFILVANTFEEAEKIIKSKTVDLMLLDLNLSGEDGFDLLGLSVSLAPQTIVISAQTDRAVKAFELGVIDFIPKPFTKERLEKAFQRLTHSEPQEERKTRFLSFRVGRRVEVIPITEIIFIKGADKYSEVTLADGRVKFHDKSLGSLIALLPATFERIHKSFIVRLDTIKRLITREGSRYFLELQGGDILPVGRTHVKQVRLAIGLV